MGTQGLGTWLSSVAPQLFAAAMEEGQSGKHMYITSKNGYNQRKPPHKLQNAIKTKTTLNLNAINTLHAFNLMIEK